MSNLPPAKLFSLTKGKSLLCLIISSSGKQGIAISDKAAEAVRDVTLKENITADALRRLVKYFEAKGLLVGGSGAFRADGRVQFGCRQLVSSLNPTMDGGPLFPVAFWDGQGTEASSLLTQYLKTYSDGYS